MCLFKAKSCLASRIQDIIAPAIERKVSHGICVIQYKIAYRDATLDVRRSMECEKKKTTSRSRPGIYLVLSCCTFLIIHQMRMLKINKQVRNNMSKIHN